MIDLPENLTEEQFFKKVLMKGDSMDSLGVAKSSVSNFKYFTMDRYNADSDKILRQLSDEKNVNKTLTVMVEFVEWLSRDHPNIVWKRLPTQKGTPLGKKSSGTIKHYMSFIKKYIKLCYGIRIYEDDWMDFVVIPKKTEEEDEEAEPLTKNEFRSILTEIQDPKRKTMYLFMKDTGFRILETMRARKKHFDFTTNPPSITIPKTLVKGKTHKKTGYLTKESAPRVKVLLNSISDEDLVFAGNPKSDIYSRNNEEKYWNRRVKKAGFAEKYNNGHLKKNIHSIRAFCSTQIYEATKDTEYSHAYIGHSRYLPQYLRKSEEERREMFKRVEPYLSIFEEIVVVDNEDLKEKIRKLEEQNKQQAEDLATIVEKLVDERLNSIKIERTKSE